jgi:hypothetical protein
VEGSSGTTIPSNVTVQLGLLTLPAGPANADTSGLVTSNGTAYTALNELAYGYSWHSCPMSTLPNATLPPNPCIECHGYRPSGLATPATGSENWWARRSSASYASWEHGISPGQRARRPFGARQ